MNTFSYAITSEVGIHGRPASMLVKKCCEFQSKITLTCKGKAADAKRILSVMALGAKKDDVIEVTAEGEDAAAAIEELEMLFKAEF